MSFFILIGFIQPEIKIKYNGKEVSSESAKPLMSDDGQNAGIIAPVDLIAPNIGATATISKDAKSIVVKKSADTLVFFDGKNTATVNGREKVMPVKALYKDTHFYIPVRFLGEILGKTVFWESRSSCLNIFDSLNNGFALDKDAREYISVDNFKVASDKLIFYNGTNASKVKLDYALEEKLNPNINRQIYNMAKLLADKSYYLNIEYNTKTEDNTLNPVPCVSLSLAKTKADVQKNCLFSFTFYEKTPISPKKVWKHKGFNQNSLIKLELNRLFETEKPEKSWIDQFYENRLKLAFVALFNETTGLEISDHIIEEYNKIRNDTVGKYNNSNFAVQK